MKNVVEFCNSGFYNKSCTMSGVDPGLGFPLARAIVAIYLELRADDGAPRLDHVKSKLLLPHRLFFFFFFGASQTLNNRIAFIKYVML